MKKFLLFFGLLLLFTTSLKAQECYFKVGFTVTPATCYNNGKVAFALFDTNGVAVSSGDDVGIEEVRIYWKVNEDDTANHEYYRGGWDTLVIDYGSYIIGVEGICRDGHGGYVKVDTHLLLNIPTTYVTPRLNSFYDVATSINGYGIHPTMNCSNTGRVQLFIEDGSFPYYVTVRNADDGTLFRIDTFFQRQYNGNYKYNYDYKDYYSIERLPKGNWQFNVEDGCGYGFPPHFQTVGVMDAPYPLVLFSYSQSGPYADSISERVVTAVVNIRNQANDFYNNRYRYHLNNLSKVAEYRFIYNAPLVTSNWKPVPDSVAFYKGSPTYSYQISLPDTLLTLFCENDYQLLNDTITLEWRDKCYDTIYRFKFKFPKNINYSSSYSDITDSTVKSADCEITNYRHTRYYYIYLRNLREVDSGAYIKPLVWVYTDVNTGTVIKRDTVAKLTSYSYLYDTDIEAQYGPLSETPLNITVERKLVDAECEIFSRTDPMTWRRYTTTSRPSWYGYTANPYYHCVGRRLYFYGSGYNLATDSALMDGTVVKLISSPNENFYNFKAVWSYSTRSWTITRSNPANDVEIKNYSTIGLDIIGILPQTGEYIFEITDGCKTYNVTLRPNFRDSGWSSSAGRTTCNSPYVYVYGSNFYDADSTIMDGTVVKLTSSPNSDFYNFTAVWSNTTKTWSITKDNPQNNINITNYSTIGLRMDGALDDGTYTFEITDGCSTYVRSATISPYVEKTWTMIRSDATCFSGYRQLMVYGHSMTSSDLNSYDSTIIRLIESPYNNSYNFEAVYSRASNDWTVTKSNVWNNAKIEKYDRTSSSSYYRWGLNITDYHLHNGKYKFEIITPCGTYIVEDSVRYSNIGRTVLVQQPEYKIEYECIKNYLVYTAGAFEYQQLQTPSDRDGDYELLSSVPIQTYVQVVDGPVGGYDAARHVLGDSIRLSIPGTFRVRIWPYGSSCAESYYDTVIYERPQLDFEYAIALLCDRSSTMGNVYVKGTSGFAPYTYTLYRRPDMQGQVIATNTTGVFPDVNMTFQDELSCHVIDSCGNYYYINLKPEIWSELQKIWFDNRMTVETACEGTTICVNALEIGDILNYKWSGPNGFTDTTSHSCVFLQRGDDEGWFKVHITNSGCITDYFDSIYLHIDRAPAVKLGQDFSVCPGEPAVLEFIPQSINTTGPVTMTVVIESENSKTTRSLSAVPGDTARYTIYPMGLTKVYTTAINDGTCNYTVVEDTQYVDVRYIAPYTINPLDDIVCLEDTAKLYASSTLTPPYIISWYKDYNLTQLVKADTISSASAKSEMILPNLTEDKLFYITVKNDDVCPTLYGKPIHTLNMKDGTTLLSHGNTYRFYDSGGQNGSYTANERLTHTFKSTDGKPVTVKFDSYYLNSLSHLYVFSGTGTDMDSMLCDITYGTTNPGTITSKGDALTFYFVAGNASTTGWNAIVDHAPAIAEAKVRPLNEITLYDTVCQSQTNNYSDKYHIAPKVTTTDSLNNAVKIAGIHTFKKTLQGASQYGCDSTVTFNLVVIQPPTHDTTVVITNMHHDGYTWHGTKYKNSGEYFHYISLSRGCDSVDILNLVVLKIDTSDNEICFGDSTDLTITVEIEGAAGSSSSSKSKVRVGDVLCTDGSTMSVDKFVASGKTAKGVVAHVDAYEGTARAIALSGAKNSTTMRWCGSGYQTINSLTRTNDIVVALADMNGPENTVNIVIGARARGTLLDAAAYHCMYYNHATFDTGTDSLGWYMPSLGEMMFVYANSVEINRTLSQLQSTNNSIKPLPGNPNLHWTSTEHDNYNNAWCVSNTGTVARYDKYGYYNVRPMIKFTLPN